MHIYDINDESHEIWSWSLCEQYKQSCNHLAKSRNRYTYNNNYHAICIRQLYIIIRVAEMKDKLFLIHIRFIVDSEEQITKSNLTIDSNFSNNLINKWLMIMMIVMAIKLFFLTMLMKFSFICMMTMKGNRSFKNYEWKSNSWKLKRRKLVNHRLHSLQLIRKCANHLHSKKNRKIAIIIWFMSF